jgi:hypothetical protein
LKKLPGYALHDKQWYNGLWEDAPILGGIGSHGLEYQTAVNAVWSGMLKLIEECQE